MKWYLMRMCALKVDNALSLFCDLDGEEFKRYELQTARFCAADVRFFITLLLLLVFT